MISGSNVEQIEEKLTFATRNVFAVTVSIDCPARTVTFEAAGRKLTSKISGSIEAITHYGCGGANSDNLFTDIAVH